METIGKLFGSTARVRAMRLFLLNEEQAFDAELVATRTRGTLSAARREIALLFRVGFLKRRSFSRTVGRRRKRVSGFILNPTFPHLAPLRYFLVSTASVTDQDIVRELRAAGGKLKLVLVAGIFIQDADSRVDLLIVGDGFRERALSAAVKNIEAEMGRELRLAVFTEKDFEYRIGIYDKLVRDILDYPHRTVLDRLGLER